MGKEGSLSSDANNRIWISSNSANGTGTRKFIKQTKLEAFMIRCEEWRFEMDMLIDGSQDTIDDLYSVEIQMNEMSAVQRSTFKLNECLGGTSAVNNKMSVARIYGKEAAPVIIQGLMNHPSFAVPMVLHRLKMKNEEWRRVKNEYNEILSKQLEKIERSESEESENSVIGKQ